MSIELIMAVISFCILAATIAGFVIKGVRGSLDNLWQQHNSEKTRTSEFREDVKSHYLRKDDLDKHINLRLDSINDRMERVEAQLTSLQSNLKSLDQSLPSLVTAMNSLNQRINKYQDLN